MKIYDLWDACVFQYSTCMPVQCTVSDIMNTQTAWLPRLTLGLWINTGAGIHFCIHSLFILPFIAQRNTAVTVCQQKSRYTCITQPVC